MGRESVFEATGIEAICARLIDGASFDEIAREHGVTHSALSQWLGSEPNRSARALAARAQAAELWDRKGEEVIRQAADPFEMSRAKELAHHYRWRAAKVAAKTYVDHAKVEVTGAGGGPVGVVAYSAEQLAQLPEEQLQAMLDAVGRLGQPTSE